MVFWCEVLWTTPGFYSAEFILYRKVYYSPYVVFCGAKLALIKSTVGCDVLCAMCCHAPVGGQSLASLCI